MNMDSEKWILIGLVSFVILLVIAIPVWAWYASGVQAEVYERQGIHMTQWEVFVGAKPAERTINLKQAEK